MSFLDWAVAVFNSKLKTSEPSKGLKLFIDKGSRTIWHGARLDTQISSDE